MRWDNLLLKINIEIYGRKPVKSGIVNLRLRNVLIFDNKIKVDDITQVFFDKFNILIIYNSVRYNDTSLNILLGDNVRNVKITLYRLF